MERHLVLLLGLLAWASAAATGAGAQPACEPSNLATQIALLCMPDMPTAPCCEPVVASVNLGGGVPCLCRVAAQPRLVLAGLNASHLLALYTACGGLRTEGAHLAASGCQAGCSRCCAYGWVVCRFRFASSSGEEHFCFTFFFLPGAYASTLLVGVRHPPQRTPSSPRHRPPRLATSCEHVRTRTHLFSVPSPGCCSAVRDTVDDPDRDCLCNVGSLDIYTVWTLYKTCGGPELHTCASGFPSSSPASFVFTPSASPAAARRPAALSVGVLVGIVLGVVAGVVVMGVEVSLMSLSTLVHVDCVDLCTTSYHCWDCTLRACPITRGAAGGTSRTSAAGGPWFTSSGTDDIIFEQRRCPLLIQHSR
ncbi:hypothetical protein HU200_037048 [Digitaria exilis]|uniref:Bifunctional inhibitor/plant lipid transfer protein/seed storage helical domain-containing protein n=1 Tax=Digitaria exilis TaxID=1010633 RepID=A0A835BCJ9_9POAL|nr:hypothetical protein HU200_037048 [Digitaria exilis]